MSDPNADRIARGIGLLSFLAALACLMGIGWLVYSGHIQQRKQAAAIESLRDELGIVKEDLEALRQATNDLESLSVQILESAQVTTSRAAVLDRERLDASSLPDGLFTLKKAVTLRYPRRNGTFTETYTIYHVKQSYGSGPNRRSLNLGVAYVVGIRPPQFYVDLNGDNAIDLKLMHDVVHALPMGSNLSQTLNEYNSQVMYNTFLNHYEEADFVSVKDVDDKAEGMARTLWEVVRKTIIPRLRE